MDDSVECVQCTRTCARCRSTRGKETFTVRVCVCICVCTYKWKVYMRVHELGGGRGEGDEGKSSMSWQLFQKNL